MISSLILFIKDFTEVNIASPSVSHQATIPSIISLIIWSATSKIGFKTSDIFSNISNNASNTTDTVSKEEVTKESEQVTEVTDTQENVETESKEKVKLSFFFQFRNNIDYED